MALANGATFAGFTIVDRLGAGRSSTVYLAERQQDSRRVALKVLDADVSADPQFRAQFDRDIEIAARLRHPNITAVLGHGEADGRLWVATEPVDGPGAARLMRERYPDGMPVTAVTTVVDGVAAALDYTHEHQLVHRHVKPANILVADPFSGGYRILLTDFATGRPRQNVSRRIDQYALAATAINLLTNRAPGTYIESGLAGDRPDLAPLDPVFARALSRNVADRYPTCRAFADALRDAATGVTTTTPAPQPAAPQPANRRWATAALAAVVVAVLAVTGWVVLKPRLEPDPPAAQAPSAAPANDQPPPPPPPGCEDPAIAATALPLRDKLAQLLMVGVTGADDARAVVADHRVGGIFIGSWTDRSMLQNGELRSIADSAAPLPLAVSVDEEGGRVQRLSSLIGSQPSPRELAATMSPEQVYAIALDRGRKMREMGITIDFAPVVDVTEAPDNTVIGDRSFGSDPQTVTAFAGAYAQGLRDAGLLPVLKHFPGHGHGSGDSHTGFVSTPALDQLMADDLIPYHTLTTVAPVAVMLGHLEVPGLTGTDPASLSQPAYDLLRSGGYGGPPFTGPVFTDDLSSMAAINQRYGVAEAVLRALQAGADVALWITTDEVPAVLDALEQAVTTGQLSTARVDDAVTHVAQMKSPRPPHCGG
ncbi:beta-glucosidase [Mycolicibacterium rutilum]|uniref:beta-N-acetylhexosaminidase n=1 Tax=Mycolicibacterium rutilum TaxID=370526 RepID=A0A1H6IIK7_MYCRU|nr:beta-glucosidase [Mycolicibacterium rutilum]